MKLSNVFTMKDKFEKMLHAAAIMTDILMQQNIKPIIQWLEHALKEKSIVKKLRSPLMIQRLSEFLRLNAPSVRSAKALSWPSLLGSASAKALS